MRTNYLYITFLLSFITVCAFATDGDRLNLESAAGMKKGTIFFAPETDLSYHATSAASSQIFGTEIYTTWGTIEKTEGVYNWTYIDNLVAQYKAAGKKVALRIATTSFSINDSPDYLYSKYNIRRVVAGYWENFEKANSSYLIHGTKTTNALSGTYSLQMSSSTKQPIIETGSTHVLDIWNGITNPSFNPTQPVLKYQSPGFCLQFDFKANTAATFYAKAYSKSLGNEAADSLQWTANAGDSGSKTLEFNPKFYKSDYKVEIGIVSGDLTIDNVNICDMKTAYYVGTLCFPNYFDPKFNERYEVFIQALANRYKDEPALSSICVGGYGRWEEMTLSDDTEANRFEDQWLTYGFTNQNYIDHVKWCIDTYKKYFTTKHVYAGSVGWNTDYYRDQTLIDWKIAGYAAKHGVGIKYNGWQAMCGDWGSTGVGFFYQANRYKFDSSMWTMFEEGGQINNNGGVTEIMGHPISLLNRAAIDGIDYSWMYQYDLQDPFTNRYFHYANEMAGCALFTKMYNQFGWYSYFSPIAQKSFNLKNIWLGVFQNDQNTGSKWTYTTINGERAVQTNAGNHRISMSIDDRQKYNGMYGAQVTLDYLDQGTDYFKVFGNLPSGITELVTVKKENSGLWKSVVLFDNGWATQSGSTGGDMLNEIEIDDNNDGIETLRSLEINYVPARDWQERVIQTNALVSGKTASLNSNYTVEIANSQKMGASGIALNVSALSLEYVNIVATIWAQVNGSYISVGSKEYYMPDSEDWFYIPLAEYPYADGYRIVLKTNQGSATINLGADNKAAYRMYSFETEAGQKIAGNTEFQIEALKPFGGLQLTGQANTTLILKKKMLNGDYVQVATVYVDGAGKGYVEPQTAGWYQLANAGGQLYSATPNYLKRLAVPAVPMRDVKGTLAKEFKGNDAFRVISGLKNSSNDNLGFHALLSAENPVISNTLPIDISSANANVFHFVMKNETGSSLSKIYWKTDKKDFCEDNSILVPIVPNDTEYREYSYPLNAETDWTDNIVGLRFMPVYGHTETGKIGIYTLDLRKGTTISSTITDSLKTTTSDFFLNPTMVITDFKINNGDIFTEKSDVSISSVVAGRVPTDYEISETVDFANASWLPYNPIFNYLLTQNPGSKTLFFKVKDALDESNILSASILFKAPNEKLDASTRQHIIAYPNPVKTNVKIECTDDESESFNVTVMTVSGIMCSQTHEVGNFKLDFSKYTKGIYIVKIENENVVSKCFIIKE